MDWDHKTNGFVNQVERMHPRIQISPQKEISDIIKQHAPNRETNGRNALMLQFPALLICRTSFSKWFFLTFSFTIITKGHSFWCFMLLWIAFQNPIYNRNQRSILIIDCIFTWITMVLGCRTRRLEQSDEIFFFLVWLGWNWMLRVVTHGRLSLHKQNISNNLPGFVIKTWIPGFKGEQHRVKNWDSTVTESIGIRIIQNNTVWIYLVFSNVIPISCNGRYAYVEQNLTKSHKFKDIYLGRVGSWINGPHYSLPMQGPTRSRVPIHFLGVDYVSLRVTSGQWPH